MTTQPLFYKKVVPLNKNQHGELYVEPVTSYKHTKDTNSVYIAAVEFLKASKEYPVVFGKNADGSIFPVVLLGLKNNQNLYLGKKGEWLADYVPAYVRRYPFILATNAGDENTFAVCIDESYPGFNKNKKGQRMFNDKGGETELLKQSVDFLKEYQNHIKITALFCKKINDLGLVEPMQANIQKSGKKQMLSGFMCVNRNKLQSLEPDKLLELMKSDQLELIFAHLNSLTNLEKLIRKFD
jgi:hypothetical protein